jgi:zinc transport system ATP-binding protein
VLIARALAARPDMLLLDEPTAGIDTAATQAIMDLLRQLHQEQKLTILMVNHDLPVVRKYVDHVVWLHEGKVLHGGVKELLSREKVEQILDLELS